MAIEKNSNSLNNPLSIKGVGEAVYFIGIGGIGMSALARYFHAKGFVVSGYDKTVTVLTRELESSGIAIHYEDNIDLIPKQVRFVVYTPAIPKDHLELNYYINNNYLVVKRSDVLQWITDNSFNICIAGTHGKTTITTMVAHILRDSGYGCNAFLGGIAANYGTNFWSSEKNVVVVEADEYDRSFLKLSPDIAIISAMDADHLDIYGTVNEVENAFIAFSNKVKAGGCLIAKAGLSREKEFTVTDRCTYSFSDAEANIHIENLQIQNGSYQFDVINNYWQLKDVVLNMGGLHNIENLLPAISVAKYLKIEDDKIRAAVANFKGVKRRFEYIIKEQNQIMVDDYAHHPEELRALITGIRSLYKEKLTLVFQPHLFSRTKDQAEGFAEVLDTADEVWLLPIYPARELPIEGITSEWLLSKMKLANKKIVTKESLLQLTAAERPALLVTAGAGDIDTMVTPLKNILTQ